MPQDARRFVVAPSALSLISSEAGQAAPPTEVPFGAAGRGTVVLLLKFPASWGARERVERAFLVLEPSPDASARSEPQTISLARILEPWAAPDVSFTKMPKLYTVETTDLAAGPPRALRIDVTELLEGEASGRYSGEGIALISGSGRLWDTGFSSGVGGGAGPVLDVYVR